jgi:hypothetical protein
VAAASSSFDPILQAHLDKSVDRLADEFGGIFEQAQIRAIVEQSAHEVAEGRVAAFVPLLAHRSARERLSAQARRSPRPCSRGRSGTA